MGCLRVGVVARERGRTRRRVLLRLVAAWSPPPPTIPLPPTSMRRRLLRERSLLVTCIARILFLVSRALQCAHDGI